MMRRVITIMNQESEIDHGFSTLSFAEALVEQGYRVVVIDSNPKGILTTALEAFDQVGLDSVLLEGTDPSQAIISLGEGYKFVPAGRQLEDFEQIEIGGLQRAKKLKQILDLPIMEEQDFILIEGPEKQGLLMINALFAAGEVMSASATSYTSLQNMISGIHVFKQLRSAIGKATKFWLVLSQLNGSNTVTEKIVAKVVSSFPSRVFKTLLTTSNGLDEDAEMIRLKRESYDKLAQDVIYGRTY